ncbi:MAG: NACHT domain-containing protein [Methylobacter sp.]
MHDLFIDLPFRTHANQQSGEILAELCRAAAQCHRYSLRNEFPDSWRGWNRHSKRARVFLIKGGPGQGKSTVGQYLCQIHRACLILDSDGPKVVDAIKVGASAVSNAAQRDGFWPTSPRIAIQIELKEFAHWYSQQPSNGILTYLAETVAKKIGSEVLVKTLKNALAKRSWIVVFDGLDEVPNDYKDKVANEVMYFLNDVLVEIDADVLALCTSRPQGYSGQFDGLDGPVLGLALLDEGAAMRCAKPLLKFGRSSEESEKSIEILEAAILSPNVKELMTTPLQSHIMAVVVREGGRPPERRWQLFNGFYLVMKKRESLKDFKNPRIAKLLQEDLLLKSVHMRLGFVLHARAERSEGAQTALSKDEFRSLVHAVVTELDDHEIEQTVADVMEAVTERLVLVSTPENGEQIRFDIRQLQEFFAAEFLYSGIDSTELGHRIETIGGDAHWREVMHFLMSALIENQRTTEVAVAVQVLRRLNEGNEGSSDNLYCRRMARAGLLANRLLIEGVLEQDQRDRQRIKPLLDPLGGIFDLEALRGLTRVTSARSRQWLIELLLEKVASANPREYVGALFLLGRILPDDHNASTGVFKAFINTPIGWQEHLYRLWSPDGGSRYRRLRFGRQENREILSKWVIDVAIDILNSPSWISYSSDLIECLLAICQDEKERFVVSCKMKNIEGEAANAILQCLKAREEPHEDRKVKRVDCGLIIGTPYSENWINSKVPNLLMGINAKNCVAETDGIFRLILTCLWFAQERSDLALKEFIRLVDNADAEKLVALPRQLMSLLPIEGGSALKPFNIDHLRGVDTNIDSWLATLAIKHKTLLLYEHLELVHGNKTTGDQWSLLAVQLPRDAIILAMNAEHYLSNSQPIFVPELVSLFQSMPCEVICHFLRWGFFARKPARTL